MMCLFTSDDLMHALGGTMTQPFHATGVSIDTRTLQAGDLFVALQTATGDGHGHVGDALAKGAAGAMVHRQHDLPDDAKLIVVGDTLVGLTALGAYARTRFTGAVVAVTGSVGKTTTKEMLRLILGASGRTQASFASYNNHWGVPLTLARMPPDDDYAIIEIGMNHAGEIAPLARLAAPDVAVITSIGSAHIGHLGSLEAIADEKSSVAQGVLQGGTVVIPDDAVHRDRLLTAAAGQTIVTFGLATSTILAEDETGSDFKTTLGGIIRRIRLNVPGRHMVMNALAALTAAHALGADVSAGADALAEFKPIGGRGIKRPILDGAAIVLDESYNASVTSIRAALSVLKMTEARRRVAILGDMLELGEHSRSEHESLASAVCDSADTLHCCGAGMRYLYQALPEDKRGVWAEDSAELAAMVGRDVRRGDALLVKGSFGTRMRIVVDALAAVPVGNI